MTGGDLREAVEQAMSDAFRSYTGSKRGDNMWNLDMEKTWAVVAPAVVEVIESARLAERERIAAYVERAADLKGRPGGGLSDPLTALAWREVAGWCRDETIWAEES